MAEIKKIKNCPICSEILVKVFRLGNFPLCDDLIKINSNRVSKLYPIELLICMKCLIVCNKYQINEKVLFPKDYHYRSRFTNDVVLGQKDLVSKIEKKYGSLKGKIILDIGSNDGTLLNEFKKKKCKTIGVEPTNATDEASKNHVIYKEYFNNYVAKKIIKRFKIIDFIIFTNVFAHINDFSNLIKNLKIILSDKTTLIIENHYLGSVIKKKQFDTFYHEHPRTYSLKSFYEISRKIQFNISYFEFPKRYGGNIRVFF